MSISVSRFRDEILAIGDKASWLYRGHVDPSWGLSSTFTRFCWRHGIAEDHIAFERMLDRFIRSAGELLQRDLSTESLEHKIAFAQHHKLPTPFLDWTSSPYVALYFAVADHARATPGGGRSAVRIWALHSNEAEQTLEKLDGVFRVIRPSVGISPRILRQRGWFTYLPPGSDLVVADKRPSGIVLKCYDVAGDPAALLSELRLMGISSGDLFQTFEGVAEDVILAEILRTVVRKM